MTSMAATPILGQASEAPPVQAVVPGRLRAYAWAVTGYNVLVVLWGAVVRATGSGAGCGEHWPLCGGTVVQHWQTAATVIEFAHRASSGLALLLLAGLIFWTWRATARRHLARTAAAAAGVLTFNEALLGALIVLLGKTAHDQSNSRAVYLSLHLANTLLLLGALGLTAHFLSRDRGRMRGGVEYRHLLPMGLGLVVTILVGVSGSLAALGDTLYPAHSLHEAFAQDFGSGASWLLRLRWVHPTLSVLTACFVGYVLVAALRSATHRRAGELLGGLLVLQFALGAGDVLLLAPTWLQTVHLLGADLLWITLVVLCARLCVVPLGCPNGGCLLGRAPANQCQSMERSTS